MHQADLSALVVLQLRLGERHSRLSIGIPRRREFSTVSHDGSGETSPVWQIYVRDNPSEQSVSA